VAREMFQTAVVYVQGVFGEGYPTPSKYYLRIVGGESHGNAGIEMYLSRGRILAAMRGDQSQRNIEHSLFVHEFVHNVQEYEDLPMLAELLYLLEHGEQERIDDIRILFSDGKFRQPYIDGLSTIAGWMGYADTISFLNELSPTMVRQMRSIFHREVENIMKELEELRLRS